jgi:hypothetical protein
VAEEPAGRGPGGQQYHRVPPQVPSLPAPSLPRALFDTAQSTNPGQGKLAEGLRSWVQFGGMVAGGPPAGGLEFGPGKRAGLAERAGEGAALSTSGRQRRLYYGAWWALAAARQQDAPGPEQVPGAGGVGGAPPPPATDQGRHSGG